MISDVFFVFWEAMRTGRTTLAWVGLATATTEWRAMGTRIAVVHLLIMLNRA